MSNLRNEGEPENGQLIIHSIKGFHEVVNTLRNVTLKDDPIPSFHPYWRSRITLEEVEIESLHPCALYVLRNGLTRTRQLRDEFLEQGIDIFAMKAHRAWVSYSGNDGMSYKVTPPIIEVSEDDGGIMVITDGLHRVSTAKELGLRSIVVIKIQDTAIPLPAFPVGWEEVQIVDNVPATENKRKFRHQTWQEIDDWIRDNWERFTQGFDLGDSMMRRHFEMEQIKEAYPPPVYAP